MAKRRAAGGQVVPGVAWYRRDQWTALRSIAADPEVLEPSYEEWLEMAEKALAGLREAGIVPRRVEVDVLALKRWCEEQGLAVDGRARSAYAAHLMVGGGGAGEHAGGG
jgi:hypothetical protein